MTRTIRLEDLDCANCAAKIENAVAKIDGVERVNVSFMGQRMELEAEEGRFDAILGSIKKAVRKVDPDVTVRA